MKTQNYQKLTTHGIPGGEGSTALPTAFINVIARRSVNDDEAISSKTGDCFAALAMTG